MLTDVLTTDDERKKEDESNRTAFNDLNEAVLTFLNHLFHFKNPAFSEEKE
jgi:hypothetical protein